MITNNLSRLVMHTDRRQLEQQIAADLSAKDAEKHRLLEEHFNNDPLHPQALKLANHVFPVTIGNRIGTAFAPFAGLICSNAHVFNTHAEVNQSHLPHDIIFVNEGVYLRPNNPSSYPDVLIAEAMTDNMSLESIPSFFYQDLQHPESKYFCINPHLTPDAPNWLTELAQPEHQEQVMVFPLPEEGIVHGMSGTPIFEAKMMMIQHQPQWVIIIAGMVFARHLEENQLFAIKLEKELEQICQIKSQYQTHLREQLTSKIMPTQNSASNAHLTLLEMLKNYSTGHTLAPYPYLPAEPLNEGRIVDVGTSVFCTQSTKHKAFKKTTHTGRNHPHEKYLNRTEIKNHFIDGIDQFLGKTLSLGSERINFDDSHSIFRLDIKSCTHHNPKAHNLPKKLTNKQSIAGKSFSMWQLEIQDCTGKEATGSENNPSSTYSVVMLPKHDSKRTFRLDQDFMAAFRYSQDHTKVVFMQPDLKLYLKPDNEIVFSDTIKGLYR